MDEGDYEDEEEYDESGVEEDEEGPPDSAAEDEDDDDTPQADVKSGSLPASGARTPSAAEDTLASGQQSPVKEPAVQGG